MIMGNGLTFLQNTWAQALSLPGRFHALLIRAPVQQPSAAELLQQVQPLAGGNVPVPPLLDLHVTAFCLQQTAVELQNG